MAPSNYSAISSYNDNNRITNGHGAGSYCDEDSAAAAAASISVSSYRRRKLLGGHCRTRIALMSGFALILVAFFTIVLFVMHTATHLRQASGVSGSSNVVIRAHALSAYFNLENGLNSQPQSDKLHGGCEATILLMRHCEKGPHTKGHCSYVGYERSHFVTTLFDTPTDTTRRWPMPSNLYATKVARIDVDHDVFREIETLTPLSKSTGVPIQYQDFGETGVNLAQHLHTSLRSGDFCGKLAVVSWKHDLIPGLAEKLGCGPLNGCPLVYSDDDFDSVWQLKFVYDPPTLWKGQKPPVIISPDNTTIVFDDSSDNSTSSNSTEYDGTDTRRRQIKNVSPGWQVFATVQKQGFDPLAYSKFAGDYPSGGTKKGGTWSSDL